MRRLVCLFVLGAPAITLAQPAPPPYDPGTATPPPPASPPPSGPYNGGTDPYGSPPPPAGPYGQPEPYGQPHPPYGLPKTSPEPAGTELRRGMTFEANLGIGWIRIASSGSANTTPLSGGLGLGVGRWISSKMAITARLAAVSHKENNVTGSSLFLGPSAQYWVDDHFWVGGGLGFAIFGVNDDNGNSDSIHGFGLNGRIGYTFTSNTENSFNASFELSPGFYNQNNESGTITSIGILLGYQHL